MSNSPWGHRQLDTTEQLSLFTFQVSIKKKKILVALSVFHKFLSRYWFN